MIVINIIQVDHKVFNKKKIPILSKSKICQQNKLSYECPIGFNFASSAHILACILGA